MAQLETTRSRCATEVLMWSRRIVVPALRAAVDRLPDSMRSVVRYHFGWQDAKGRKVQSTDGGGGRAIRPALALLAAEAVGAGVDSAIPAACAVELVHNFTLLHDDLMDRDPIRRGRPACWSVFGASTAILAGDALLALAFDVLGRRECALGSESGLLASVLLEMVDGQGADISFEGRIDVELADCMRMAAGKTGALLAGACALGAMAGGSRTQVEHLRAFGAHLGFAYQCLDDVQGIWGDPRNTGKAARSDLVNRKKTLPVVATLCSDTAAGRELAEFYHGEGPLPAADVARAATLIEIAGGRDWAEAMATKH
ncbi:MAG: polyprenyl synthetase family protein, partial [Sciscionella sp.]|nr:polyprenyl synthetase family protein [Sciscionella sp.]